MSTARSQLLARQVDDLGGLTLDPLRHDDEIRLVIVLLNLQNHLALLSSLATVLGFEAVEVRLDVLLRILVREEEVESLPTTVLLLGGTQLQIHREVQGQGRSPTGLHEIPDAMKRRRSLGFST
jgi:hypothetical protein